MYRVAKKCTKNTQEHCLKCKYCNVIRETVIGEKIVECTAENRCIVTEFNANHFYCVEMKGFSDMTSSERYSLEHKINTDYQKKMFKEYVNRYYPQEQARSMIANYNKGGNR